MNLSITPDEGWSPYTPPDFTFVCGRQIFEGMGMLR